MTTINKPTFDQSKLTTQQQADLDKVSKDSDALARTNPQTAGQMLGSFFGFRNARGQAEKALNSDYTAMKKDGFDQKTINSLQGQVRTEDYAGRLSRTMTKTGNISGKDSTAQIKAAFHIYAKNNGAKADAATYDSFSKQMSSNLLERGVPQDQIDDALQRASPTQSTLQASSMQSPNLKA